MCVSDIFYIVRKEKENRRGDDDAVQLFGDEISLQINHVMINTAKVKIHIPILCECSSRHRSILQQRRKEQYVLTVN